MRWVASDWLDREQGWDWSWLGKEVVTWNEWDKRKELGSGRNESSKELGWGDRAGTGKGAELYLIVCLHFLHSKWKQNQGNWFRNHLPWVNFQLPWGKSKKTDNSCASAALCKSPPTFNLLQCDCLVIIWGLLLIFFTLFMQMIKQDQPQRNEWNDTNVKSL